MGRLKSWIEKRKARREKRDYYAGYDWAAGSMLRGELTPGQVCDSCEQINPSQFGRGAVDATEAYADMLDEARTLGKIKTLLTTQEASRREDNRQEVISKMIRERVR